MKVIMPLKIRSFLKELKELEECPAEAREKAAIQMAQMLDNGKDYVLYKKGDIYAAANDIEEARERLEDIHYRLELSIKSGNVSESVH